METGRRLSHAYIVVAPPEPGWAEARRLAQAMVCTGAGARPCGVCPHCRKVSAGTHPDILTVSRQTDDKGKPRREIYVDQIREIAATAAVLPNEAERKVYIVRDSGTMNPAAQNAFLKLLEDPPAFDAFLLITENAELLLETVRSRCVTVYAGGEEEGPSPEAREMAERWIDIAAAKARVSLLSFANAGGERSPQELADFARAARLLLTDMLCFRLPDRKIPRAELLRLAWLMDRTAEYLRLNVSGKHVMGMLSAETIPYD